MVEERVAGIETGIADVLGGHRGGVRLRVGKGGGDGDGNLENQGGAIE